MDIELIRTLRCPECASSLSQAASGDGLVCDSCGFSAPVTDGFYPVISGQDMKKYSWLEQLNREDRPEYHEPEDRVHGKEQYVSSGYLDRLFGEICPKETDLVLDLGCGRGQISDPLSERVEAVLSVDLVPENLRDVRNPNKLLATADNIPVLDNSIDLVLFTDVLEHLPTEIEEKVLSEIFRVLKPGGRLLISYPGNNLPNLSGVHLINSVIFLIRLFDKRVSYMSWVEPPAHINMSYPWRIARAFRKAGFVGKIRPYNNKFLSLPNLYQMGARLLNLPIIRNFFIHQMHGLLRKPGGN